MNVTTAILDASAFSGVRTGIEADFGKKSGRRSLAVMATRAGNVTLVW